MSIKKIQEKYILKRKNYRVGYKAENGSLKGINSDPKYKRLFSDEKRAKTIYRKKKESGLLKPESLTNVSREFVEKRKQYKEEYRNENGSLKGIKSDPNYTKLFAKEEEKKRRLRQKRKADDVARRAEQINDSPEIGSAVIEQAENEQDEEILSDTHAVDEFYFNVLPDKLLAVFDLEKGAGFEPTLIITNLDGQSLEYITRYSANQGAKKLYAECYAFQSSFKGKSDKIPLISIYSEAYPRTGESFISAKAYLPSI